MTFRFVDEHKGRWPVRLLCEALAVSPAGYYAWRRRPRSARRRRDALLVGVRAIHAEVKARYGSPRIHAELAARGHACCVNTVARLIAGGRHRRQGRQEVPPHHHGLRPRPARRGQPPSVAGMKSCKEFGRLLPWEERPVARQGLPHAWPPTSSRHPGARRPRLPPAGRPQPSPPLRPGAARPHRPGGRRGPARRGGGPEAPLRPVHRLAAVPPLRAGRPGAAAGGPAALGQAAAAFPPSSASASSRWPAWSRWPRACT
jgi:hypothetical protein